MIIFTRSVLCRIRFKLSHISYRHFLSEAFLCKDEWQSRLQTPLMRNIKIENLYSRIEQSFLHLGWASAIDIDVFLNKLQFNDNIRDEISDLLHKIRLTEETTNTLESSGHAVIRNFVDMGEITKLLHILDNQFTYGIFLDSYVASYSLDQLIKKNDYYSASRIAAQLTRQDELNTELNLVLALFACLKYLSSPDFFLSVKDQNKSNDTEVVQVYVKYMREPYSDSHFKIKDSSQLLGNTLISIGLKFDCTFGKNAKFLGEILSKNFESAIRTIQNATEIYQDTIKLSIKLIKFFEKSDMEYIDSTNNLLIMLNNVASTTILKAENIEEDLAKFVKQSCQKLEQNEIEKQKIIYLKWNTIREKKLNNEIQRINRTERLKDIQSLIKTMKKQEEELWFFQNAPDIELKIHEKKKYYPKRWFGKKKIPKFVDEAYVPPELARKSSK